HQAEEESEETADNFLEGRSDIDDFLSGFMEKRTVAEEEEGMKSTAPPSPRPPPGRGVAWRKRERRLDCIYKLTASLPDPRPLTMGVHPDGAAVVSGSPRGRRGGALTMTSVYFLKRF
ncbi:hypothetical protein CRUP_017378, partial [Coryphaenoides rupestris]